MFKLGKAFVFTFMSFMMSWKSPPKALHSFSIPASIFPESEKKNLLDFPNKQTFLSVLSDEFNKRNALTWSQ